MTRASVLPQVPARTGARNNPSSFPTPPPHYPTPRVLFPLRRVVNGST
jgi:hypothetical protein